ncbi:MAG: CRISPR-associated protein, Csy4 family [uncultured Sulfurovum sp.]|uniref:CRISPR-associated protein, Csy4 family n=1 Tax=uncultured Sulfurovum sp. TaxID=269237 RepID=A0A6S6SET4_9BACT|nr:MAG: CRISPR-associated protein, Csy4 family [uncultured Sulfurovum sp.]
MTYYLDIKLMPKKEIRENVLLNQVYTAFHKRLYDLKSKDIAVSFPEYRFKLGRLFRIHGTKEALEKLNEKDWLGKYKEFSKTSNIEEVPTNVQHRTVSRVQQNMTEAKLRRLIKRGTIPEEDVKKYRIKMLQGGLENPYVELVSMSNGQLHRRFIEFGEFQEVEVKDEFDLFGLSKVSTIPWF